MNKVFGILTNSDCNLNCRYCFTDKVPCRNSLADMLEYVDAAFNECMKDGEVSQITFDFIGGEPFLCIDELDKVVDRVIHHYHSIYGEGSVGLKLHFTTNGTQFCRESVQKFLDKYKEYIYIDISIDGHKESHDLNRIDYNGNGSYDTVISGYYICKQHIPNDRIRASFTLTHDTIQHCYSGLVDIINKGFTNIILNVNFNEVWSIDYSDIIYNEIRDIVDYIILNNMDNNVFIQQINKMSIPPFSFVVEPKCVLNRNTIYFGLDKQLYGCYKFASLMVEPIGRLKDASFHFDDYNLLNLHDYHVYYHEDCSVCRFNKICYLCPAYSHITGMDTDSYLSSKYFCGFITAIGRGMVYFHNKTNKRVLCNV